MCDPKLIIVVDDRETVYKCLFLFLTSLIKTKAYQIFSEILILVPTYVEIKYYLNIISIYNEVRLSLSVIDILKIDDPYFVKFAIKKYLEKTQSDPTTPLLYLDYDHIFLKKFTLDMPKPGTLFVSSEISYLKPILMSNKPNLKTQYHFNTSLLYGRVNDLLNAMDKWIYFYNKLHNTISIRYLEEVSFSFSAIDSGMCILPISKCLQGGWHSFPKSCKLFHYGGDNLFAKMSKNGVVRYINRQIDSPLSLRTKSEQVYGIINFLFAFSRRKQS